MPSVNIRRTSSASLLPIRAATTYLRGNGEGSAAEAYFIGLAPRPAPAPELPPGVQVDLEPIPGIGFAFDRNLDSTRDARSMDT